MTTIALPIMNSVEWKFWPVLHATLLPTIAPHLAMVATFAAHRGYHGMWIVSNVETGALVAMGADMETAIVKAREKLSGVSIDAMETEMNKMMEKYRKHALFDEIFAE